MKPKDYDEVFRRIHERREQELREVEKKYDKLLALLRKKDKEQKDNADNK